MVQWNKMGSQNGRWVFSQFSLHFLGHFSTSRIVGKTFQKASKNYLYNPPKKTCLADVYQFHDFSRGWKKSPCPIGNASSTGPFSPCWFTPAFTSSKTNASRFPPFGCFQPPRRDGTTFDPPRKTDATKNGGRWRSHGNHSWRMPEGIHQFTKNLLI